MSKKYKLKGAKPAKTLSFGETPEGVPFFEISEKTGAIRFLNNGYIEFYSNGKLVRLLDPTLKPIEPRPIQAGDFEISQTSYGANVIYRPKIAKGGVIE